MYEINKLDINPSETQFLENLRKNFCDWLYKSLDYGYFSPIKTVVDKTKYPLIIFLHWMWHWWSKRSQINDSYFPYMTSDTLQSKFEAWWANILLPRLPEFKPHRLYKNKLQDLIENYVINNEWNIDCNNIFIMWSSAGGAMAWNLLIDNPSFYSKALITCAPKVPSKGELKKISDKPIWIVSAKKDPIIPFITQEMTRSRIEQCSTVPEMCIRTVFPWSVFSPDWKLIKLPHLLAKVISTDFVPLKIPNYDEIKYNGEDYPWTVSFDASWHKVPTRWIIDWLQK